MAGLTRSMRARNQTLGHTEEEILQQTRGLERKLLEEAAQKKADQSPPVCPVCGHPLTRQTRDQERTCQTRFGPVTIRRLRGWCRALSGVAFSGRSCFGVERGRQRLAGLPLFGSLLAAGAQSRWRLGRQLQFHRVQQQL
jgi:transposase